jgi:hypothetical protein
VVDPGPAGEPAASAADGADEPGPDTGEDAGEEDPLAPKLDSSVPPQWECAVSVEAVVADESFRGHPNTPAHQDWVSQLSPADYEMYSAESHGESYKSCTYRVVVGARAWTFTETWSTTFAEVAPGWCEDARAHVGAAIQRTTQGCRDLHRGADYGADLIPLP